MSETTLNPIIHAPNRLQICAILKPLEEAEFKVLREELGVSDSVLSKHVSQLADAGYAKVRKGITASRPRTWVKLTAKGHRAFDTHIAALQQIVSRAQVE